MSDQKPERDRPASGITRRFFLKAVGGAGIGTAALADHGLMGAQVEGMTSATQEAAAGVSLDVARGEMPIELNINGRAFPLKVEPRVTLLDALRNHLDLTGSKLVCDRGSCGACTVYLDGMPVNSCMVLAIDAVGQKITTIEGLAKGEGDQIELDPVQAAYLECDALQCGFCTPGFVMATKAVLDANPKASLEEVKQGIAGNICRCGTYNHIFEAAERARAAVAAKAKA